MTLTAEQIKTLTTTPLAHGSHDDHSAMCAMELVAYVAGEPWGDDPACSCQSINAFLRHWNDVLPDEVTRTRLISPLLPGVIGTRTTDADRETRGFLALDWLWRVHLPAFLRLTPAFVTHADALASLPPLTDAAVLLQSQRVRAAASASVRAAAWATARDTVRDAAWGAAWGAERAAVRGAASAVVRGAAWDAAWVASWAAERAAEWTNVDPTIATMQASAQDLVRRMCAVGRDT